MAQVIITELTDNVTVEETTQNITVSGATAFPITLEYNATVVQGDQGPAGPGVAAGGTTGQILAKTSNADYETNWVDPINLTSVGTSIIPSADSQFDLGSPTNKWRSLYVSGQTIYFDDASLSISQGQLLVNDQPVPVDISTDTTPKLGGDLDLNGNDIYTSGNTTVTANALVADFNALVLNTTSSLNNSDTFSIDVNRQRFSIVDKNDVEAFALYNDQTVINSGRDLNLNSGSNNRIILDGMAFPKDAGSAGQVLKTNGSDNLYWADEEESVKVSESQPQIAVIGDQWFNPTTQILKVYTAAGWVQVTADDLQF